MWRACGAGACALAVSVTAAAAADGAGSARNGKTIYERQCLVCHETAPEYHKEGPALAGIYGRQAGTAPFFGKYKALKGANFAWDEKTLDRWLADPRSLVDGRDTGMTLRIDDPAQRADLIAYLKSLR
jgi:cytochrome c